MNQEHRDYEFIIVGAGASGCSVASALARSKRRPSVLLLEAGDSNEDPSVRVHGNMYTQNTNSTQNWGYKSTPLPQANNRQISLDRGKGLGGSTAINFTFWTRGPRDEWDELARLTDDDAWKWENTERRFGQIEGYRHLIEPGTGAERYCTHGPDAYGTSGPLRLCSQSTKWSGDLAETTDVWESCGYPMNTDSSTGNPIGLQVCPLTGHLGTRSTAADLLRDAPGNLYVRTDSIVHQVMFEDSRASAVKLANGTTITATKEIILCIGALDTPKILMQSGIGPAEQLSKFRISVVHYNEHIGRNLRDHYYVLMLFAAREDASEALHNAPATGGAAMGFFKDEGALSSSEFQTLTDKERGRLGLPTGPTWEIAHDGARVRPGLEHMGPTSQITLFILNSQGLGDVKLRSANPSEPPLVQPGFLEHPWDKRIAVDSTRECLRVMEHPASSKRRDRSIAHICPKSSSEEDILEFWRDNLTSTWHMMGTCKMGRVEGQDGACADTAFKVFGVQGLRVADLSVLPLLPSVHTQTYAYQIGMIAAEKIISDYGLST
ncbi:Uu.00g095920.m01.CDS01 [Anthostomella pinea]|uniref:Uu.00g095920.m01.CDS01 n=1 Tax=Anthostomella pinea TaxID=933095 RepID=A0AAI8VC69_9PEZI|nr:Uu.00g095920.m01.CDS01 [Anthostomella pinea]